MPHPRYAARQQTMRGRFTSLLLLIGLFFGVVVMPVIAHANGNSPVHASEVLDLHEIDAADHSHSQGADKEMPCHAVSHHHCSIALAANADTCSLSVWGSKAEVMPLIVQPMPSLALAPPTEPPAA